jgi:hypothetical protein
MGKYSEFMVDHLRDSLCGGSNEWYIILAESVKHSQKMMEYMAYG